MRAPATQSLSRHLRRSAAGLAMGLACVTAPVVQAANIIVPIDNTRLMRLKADAATVVVGNPSIADVTVEDGRTLFVIGRTFGTTNVIALDADGNQLSQFAVTVSAASPGMVTMYRGANAVSYSCTPVCQRVAVPGDDNEAFSEIVGQFQNKLQSGASGGN